MNADQCPFERSSLGPLSYDPITFCDWPLFTFFGVASIPLRCRGGEDHERKRLTGLSLPLSVFDGHRALGKKNHVNNFLVFATEFEMFTARGHSGEEDGAGLGVVFLCRPPGEP